MQKKSKKWDQFFDGFSGSLETYEEAYVDRFINQIDIYNDKVTIIFEDGQAISRNE